MLHPGELIILNTLVFMIGVLLIFALGSFFGRKDSERTHRRLKQKKKAKKAGKIDCPAVLFSAIKKILNPTRRKGKGSSVIVLAGEGLTKKTEAYFYVARMDWETLNTKIEDHLRPVFQPAEIPKFLLRPFTGETIAGKKTVRIEIPIEEEEFDAKLGSSGGVIVHFNPFDLKEKPTFTWDE
jgi:hypothetical protein